MEARSQAVSEPPGGACSSASEASLLEVIASLEKLKAQVEGLQAILEVEHRRRSVHAQREVGVRREHLGRGVAEEIGLARGISAKRAADQLAVRRVLVESLPQTFAKVLTGELQVWPAEQVAQVAIVLDDDDRARLDAEVSGRVAGWSPSSVKGRARRVADRLDQEAAVRRLRRTESQRHVSVRPVADGMVRLSALVPTAAGVAAFASLTKHAAAARARGDARSKGQLMADVLVERTTGVADPADLPVEIQLLMTDRTLLAGGTDPALLEGHALPAEVARALALCPGTGRGTATGASAGISAGASIASEDARTAVDAGAQNDPAAPLRYLRRLFTDPVSGSLTDMDQRRRSFTGAVRTFIRARDQRCRIPHCHAPIRDIDHVTRHADGGATSIENGVGLCQRHNLAKEMPGWSARIDAHAESGRAGMLVMRTPSGAEYVSPAPDLHALTGPPLGAGGHRPAEAEPPPTSLEKNRHDGASIPDDSGRADDLHLSGDTARPGDAVCPEGHARPEATASPDGTVLHVDPVWAVEQAIAEQLVFADDLTDDEVRALMRECETAWGIPA